MAELIEETPQQMTERLMLEAIDGELDNLRHRVPAPSTKVNTRAPEIDSPFPESTDNAERAREDMFDEE